jgi:mgtE-like transporter
MGVFDPKQMLARSIPILTLLVLVEMVGGSALGSSYDSIRPIFLILLPPFLAIGGNVGSVFGSRVSSALHLGLIGPGVGESGALRANLVAMGTSGLVSYSFLGIVVYFVFTISGNGDLGPAKFLAITLLSGSCLTLFTLGVSTWTCFTSFRRGLDPDDVVVPIVTTFTDLMGIVLLLFFIALLGT